MSAFMVSEKTLEWIAAVLDDIDRNRNSQYFVHMNTYPVESELASRERRNDSDSLSNFGNLYGALWVLNFLSLKRVYGQKGAIKMAGDYTLPPEGPRFSGGYIVANKPAELLKRIQCYLYQSCECKYDEDNTNQSLYDAVQALRDALAVQIAEDTPEYKASDAWE